MDSVLVHSTILSSYPKDCLWNQVSEFEDLGWEIPFEEGLN
jgi:hypothetical protein